MPARSRFEWATLSSNVPRRCDFGLKPWLICRVEPGALSLSSNLGASEGEHRTNGSTQNRTTYQNPIPLEPAATFPVQWFAGFVIQKVLGLASVSPQRGVQEGRAFVKAPRFPMKLLSHSAPSKCLKYSNIEHCLRDKEEMTYPIGSPSNMKQWPFVSYATLSATVTLWDP